MNPNRIINPDRLKNPYRVINPNRIMPCNSPMAIDVIRCDWYQTQTHVVIVILEQYARHDVVVRCVGKELTVKFVSASGKVKIFDMYLAHNVVDNSHSYRVLSTKIDIKLEKCDKKRWSDLQDAGLPKYPSSSSKAKDGEKMEAEITKAEEKNVGKGDEEADLNVFFQKIFNQGSDGVKKAINKSFAESDGTVLSTTWTEVERDETTVRAPGSME